MNAIYNNEIKQKFLSDYPEKSQSTYARVFTYSFSVEEALGKDLYDFSKAEIEEVLYDLNPLTSGISQHNGRIISAYIAWAVNNNLRTNGNINPLKAVDADWFDKFVDKTKKLYFSHREIQQIEDFCENAQDAVIIRLLFEGVNGRESSEIRQLNMNDVNFDNNTLTLRDEDGRITRKGYQVSDRCIRLIREALSESTYMKRNGMMAEVDNVRQFTDLIDNDYVLRNSVTRTDNYNGAIHPSVIYRRINLIGELLNLPYYTSKNIFRSGVIAYAKQILDEEGVLDKEQYVKIAERFQVKNWYTLKDYCNYETIHKLYNEIAVASA